MKRVDLERHLRAHGCDIRREGGSHTIWQDPTGSVAVAVPRHREINNVTARDICDALGVPRPQKA